MKLKSNTGKPRHKPEKFVYKTAKSKRLSAKLEGKFANSDNKSAKSAQLLLECQQFLKKACKI